MGPATLLSRGDARLCDDFDALCGDIFRVLCYLATSPVGSRAAGQMSRDQLNFIEGDAARLNENPQYPKLI